MELKVESKNLDVSLAKVGKDKWQINSPVLTEADDLTMSLIFSALKDAKKEKVVDSR